MVDIDEPIDRPGLKGLSDQSPSARSTAPRAARDLARVMQEIPEVEAALVHTGVLGRLDAAAREVGLATAGLAFSAAIPAETIEELTAAITARVVAELQSSLVSDSPYMTVGEAAAYMRATPQRVRRLRSQGVFAKHGDGGNALVLRSQVEDWCRRAPRRGQRT